MYIKDIKVEIKPGAELTVAHDIVGISGTLKFEKGQKVKIDTVDIKEGFWGRGSGVWYDDELLGVTLEGYEGFWFPRTFEETQK